MLKALPPPSHSRAAEILSRYRPIAPKPDTLPSFSSAGNASVAAGDSDGKIQQSPYTRNLCTQLPKRPARTRKRGRAPAANLSSSKRHRAVAPAAHAPFPPPCQYVCGLNHAGAAVAQRGTGERTLATLSLLPGSDTGPTRLVGLDDQKFVTAAAVPEEKDLLRQLQVPCTESHRNNSDGSDSNNSALVISPRPVRPVGSSIVVGSISEAPAIENQPPSPRKALEVEEEVESDAVPAIISDSNGRVRLANSAYKEMVGQPECPWLDAVVVGGNSRRSRISGDVILRFSKDATKTWLTDNDTTSGFQSWVRIEWGKDEGRKTWVEAVCDVRRLWCESKDYVFYWRFHAPGHG